MSTYSKNKKLIKDYIDGNDIDIDVDLLENDLDFMIAAIDYSNDKKLYKLCSDEIKYNFQLIKFLVEKFHYNLEFIIETVKDYLESYDNTYWYQKYNEKFFIDDQKSFEELEVLITIDKYLPNKTDERILEIKLRLKEQYTRFRVGLEIALESHPEIEIGKGFSLIEKLFSTSYLIKDYYAKSIIDEIIMACEGNTYEEKIHKLYSSQVKPESALKMLISIANKYDIELANYIIVRPEVFKEYIHNFDIVISNWNNYNNKILDDRILDILDAISDYYYRYGHLLNMEEIDTINYFANLLKLEERFKTVEPILMELKSIDIDDELKGKTYHDRKMLKVLTPLVKNIMQGKNEYALTENIQNQEKNKNNITSLNSKR